MNLKAKLLEYKRALSSLKEEAIREHAAKRRSADYMLEGNYELSSDYRKLAKKHAERAVKLHQDVELLEAEIKKLNP